jgi:uncharacterized membrane protein YeaQ/YmgE (transglycosylase-associated protein family)
MNILITLIVGGVCGWLASLIMKTDKQMGILANIAVGIVGSLLGGWMFGVLGLAAYGLLGRLVMTVVGAVVLIWILKALKILR